MPPRTALAVIASSSSASAILGWVKLWLPERVLAALAYWRWQEPVRDTAVWLSAATFLVLLGTCAGKGPLYVKTVASRVTRGFLLGVALCLVLRLVVGALRHPRYIVPVRDGVWPLAYGATLILMVLTVAAWAYYLSLRGFGHTGGTPSANPKPSGQLGARPKRPVAGE